MSTHTKHKKIFVKKPTDDVAEGLKKKSEKNNIYVQKNNEKALHTIYGKFLYLVVNFCLYKTNKKKIEFSTF